MILERAERIIRAPFEVPKKGAIKGDVAVLASFPKSGNTWFRFAASAVLAYLSKKESVDFHNIDRLSPVIRGNQRLRGAIYSAAAPTFLKTHFYNVKGFSGLKTVLLYRDPVKTMLSFYKYMLEEHGKSYSSLNAFVKAPRVGCGAWSLFHRSWLDSESVLVVKYEDLIKNQHEGLLQIYRYLGYDLPEGCLSFAIESSTRENMSRVEIEKGDPHKKSIEYKFVGSENRHSEADSMVIADFVRDQTNDILLELDSRRLVF